MTRSPALTVIFSGALLTSCANELDVNDQVAAAGAFEEIEDNFALTRTCSDGETVRGIDVSKWQGNINWDQVAADGVEYAFIRVSDGTSHIDQKFDRNWSEARRVGIRRGAYQFFRPNRDPIAQADILINMMGPLEPGDLPPVLDLEAAGGLARATVASRARQWLDRVEAATGVKPILYTGPYFWRDAVGSPAWGAEHRLWVAHYTTGCPLTPNPWGAWTFHQFTDRGSVRGISGGVDVNYFNGSLEQLDALAVGGEPPPPPPPCEILSATGGTLEEDGACGELGGPSQYLRAEDGGSGGYIWTGAINGAPTNYAEWELNFEQSGVYRVEVYLPAGGGTTQHAVYELSNSAGDDEIVVNQSAVSGWVSLGRFAFNAGAGYRLRLTDSTGEPGSLQRRVAFDAVRVIPDDAPMPPPAEPPPAAEVCEDIDGGAVIEEDGPCGTLGGPDQYLRAETASGSGGGYIWTGATASGSTYNYAEWALPFTSAGRYKVEAYLAPGAPTSTQARYFVTHGSGTEVVSIDQAASAGGYVELGIFDFSAAPGQKVFLGDNTGESSSLGRRIVFDALRVTPADDAECPRVRVNTGINLNVRPTPSTSQAAVGQLPGGTVVDRISTVTGQSISGNTDWFRVNQGYISARFASCE